MTAIAPTVVCPTVRAPSRTSSSGGLPAGAVLHLRGAELAALYADGEVITDQTWPAVVGSAAVARGSTVQCVHAAVGGQPGVRLWADQDCYVELGSGPDDLTAGWWALTVGRFATARSGQKVHTAQDATDTDEAIGVGRNGVSSDAILFSDPSHFFVAGGALPAIALDWLVEARVPAGSAGAVVTGTLRWRDVVASGAVTVPAVVSRTRAYLGRSLFGDSELDGWIAEHVVYARAPSPSEIAAALEYFVGRYGPEVIGA